MRRMTFRSIIREAESAAAREMTEYLRDTRRRSLHEAETAELRNLGLVHQRTPRLRAPLLADALLRFRFKG